MKVAVVVEQVWDPVSIEMETVSGAIDWSRAAAVPGVGSLEALELGLSLGEVYLYGLGVGSVPDLLRVCLAMGASRAVEAPDLYVVADAMRQEGFELVLAPHRSGDQGASPVGPTLAGLLDLPQATSVEALRWAGPEVVVIRRLDRGEREELALLLPAVIAVEPDIARPRVATPAAMIAAQTAEVPALAPSKMVPRPLFRGHEPPRPAPPRMPVPDADLPAEARIAAVVGTAADARQHELVTGSAEEVADRIAQVLVERGYAQTLPRAVGGVPGQARGGGHA
jgi:electron transfer flavoprotein beta subunit